MHMVDRNLAHFISGPDSKAVISFFLVFCLSADPPQCCTNGVRQQHILVNDLRKACFPYPGCSKLHICVPPRRGGVRDAWPTPDTMSHDEGTGKEEEGVDSAGVEGRSCRGVSCREVSCCEVSFSTNLAPTGKSGDCRRGGDDPMFATVWDITKRLCTRVGGTCRWLAHARSRRRVTSPTAMSRFFSARWARFCMDFFPVVSCRTCSWLWRSCRRRTSIARLSLRLTITVWSLLHLRLGNDTTERQSQ